MNSFILRDAERGHETLRSDGSRASYLAGHPDGFVTRASSFNFNQYQAGRPGFGPMRVFGDEVFRGSGVGYNMHPHHNFAICAFVISGQLTHINTAGGGMVDSLKAGDFYVFSAGSGGKHCELSITGEDTNIIYVWVIPEQLYLPPSYHRAHFDFRTRRNRIEHLVGDADGALPMPQDFRVSRLVADKGRSFEYAPRTLGHGAYVFVLEGAATVAGAKLRRRDSIGLWDAESFTSAVEEDETDLLIIETVMIDAARSKERS
jgi:quercetin 2,3-dioxygenase